jgi:hypothetical protein
MAYCVKFFGVMRVAVGTLKKSLIGRYSYNYYY